MPFCQTLSPGITYTLQTELRTGAREWDSVLPPDHGLRSKYLLAIEESAIRNLDVFYLTVFSDGKKAGQIYLQRLRLGMENLAPEIREMGAARLLGPLSFQRRPSVLVCGNLFQLGSPGYWFREPEQAFRVLEIVDDWETKTGGRRSAFLIKDAPRALPDAELTRHGFRVFEGDVTMELRLEPEWKTMEDYFQALSKKYRQRARKITDAGKELVLRYLEENELDRRGGELESLYRQVWERQPWKPACLGREYFLAMNRHLGREFRIQGLFEGEKLLAFASHQLHPGHVLEIHYIGLDYSRNEDSALYFNLLFGAIRAGIEQGRKCIWFGRTSEDAKASAGALPVHPLHYIKIRRGLASVIFQKVQAMARDREAPEWQKRNPFKTDIPVSYEP